MGALQLAHRENVFMVAERTARELVSMLQQCTSSDRLAHGSLMTQFWSREVSSFALWPTETSSRTRKNVGPSHETHKTEPADNVQR